MIKKQKNINFGAAILFLIFSLLFFVLLFRFVYIQTTGEVKGHALAAKAEQLYSNSTKIEAKRGTIYDRNGEVIAEDRTSYSLIAILDEKMTTDPKKPKHVKDIDKTASELAKVIDMKESDIYKILQDGQQKERFQVEFGVAGRDITYEVKENIEELKLPGVTFTRKMKRFYPNGIFASHVIGYTETVTDENNQTKTVGKLGLEKSLNELLTGTNGSFKFESDLWGYLLPDGNEQITPASDGKDVYLTIDRKIQIMLEDAMNKVNEEYDPAKMIAIVADAKTGEILAMGQRPSFHPETRIGIEGGWYNEAIETPFEPGSTMKIFTLAAAVEEGAFNPNEKFQSGKYVVDPKSRSISDHNGGRGWGTITYLEGVQRSSNVAFAKLANEKIGFDKFREYLTEFGFDELTGIDLPNEANGKMAFTYPIEKATTAFGQGTAVTAIQQVQAATAITNGGKMMGSHVIDKVVDPGSGKTIQETKSEVVGEPISEKTAADVRDYLETVITGEEGTGGKYEIEGYEVAGKTGTAQISGNGGYLSGSSNYIFSFLGMAPKDDPELIMYVAVQQPEITNYAQGSTPVSMIFNPVMKNSLQYLQVEPSNNKPVETVINPDVMNLSTDQAIEKLTNKGLEAIVIGNGSKIVSQIPRENESLLAGERVMIKTDGELTAPNMMGWSIRDVMKVAEVANMKLNSVGNGFVVKQNVTAGSMMKEGDYLIVELNRTLVQTESESDVKTETDIETNVDEDIVQD
ncbi:penicillin-binding protein [Bacillus sp. V3B]|uniref:penicillin-binding protein n=1 Tax=Bacillus sp. V3B TaxID=2804915 RepID=UPI00210C5401|nr:penicillin-binding protein [Bacillus sp. V3B]MCQ6273996.1 penicillin-binding protein [Bacillus sp. V3B]